MFDASALAEFSVADNFLAIGHVLVGSGSAQKRPPQPTKALRKPRSCFYVAQKSASRQLRARNAASGILEAASFTGLPFRATNITPPACLPLSDLRRYPIFQLFFFQSSFTNPIGIATRLLSAVTRGDGTCIGCCNHQHHRYGVFRFGPQPPTPTTSTLPPHYLNTIHALLTFGVDDILSMISLMHVMRPAFQSPPETDNHKTTYCRPPLVEDSRDSLSSGPNSLITNSAGFCWMFLLLALGHHHNDSGAIWPGF
ncbi:hypothetical protein P154DRAFT_618340 [Amniculicola lignicola CBS 123094]|uniref:Uncharacterized protein n=1 Tax=Amniculicola lignicola CBS 123094 TaxID=1392246 RepID=A0A6A5WP84_9PLEO|nr:hypothetical protein P154DRAFT_618340 [Amniculicola lignicola CBS 123094]